MLLNIVWYTGCPPPPGKECSGPKWQKGQVEKPSLTLIICCFPVITASTSPPAAVWFPSRARRCLPSGPSRLLFPLPRTFFPGFRLGSDSPDSLSPQQFLLFLPSSRPSLWFSIYFCDHPVRPCLPLAPKLSRDLDLHCVTLCRHLGSQPGAWLPAQCVFVEVGGQGMRLKAGRGAESFENEKSWPRAPAASFVLWGKCSEAH